MYTKELINNLSECDLFNEKKDLVSTKSKKAVAMGRVSTKEQKDQGQSDDAQMVRIRSYASSHKLSIIKEWDVAETASKHHARKNFHEMTNIVRDSQESKYPIKHIIFSHQSRSNRNRESAREIEMLIKLHDVTLHCVRDNLTLHANSPFDDWLRWDIFNNLNAKFIEDHKKNVFDGTRGRLSMGLFPGKAPYGYRNQRLAGGLSIFKIQEEEAEFISTAFQLFSTGNYSGPSLWKELKTMFPMTKSPTGHKSLYRLLRKRFYYGEFEYMGKVFKSHPEYQPAIVSFNLWKTVQDKVNGHKRLKTSTKSLHYLGMISCGGFILDRTGKETDEVCGCKVTAEPKRKLLKDGTRKEYYYYHCSNTTRKCSQRNKTYMKEVAGRNVNYSQTQIEELFEEIFKPLAFEMDQVLWMQEILLSQHKDNSEDHSVKLSVLQRRQKMLESYIDKSYEDKLNGSIPEDMWRKKHELWMGEKDEILSEIESINSQKDEYIEEGINLIELAQHTENIYKNASPEVKRKLVEIVSSNRVLKDGSIEFYYQKPFNWLAESKGRHMWWRWPPACNT